MHTVVETTDGAYHVVRDGRVIARVDTFNPFDAEAKKIATRIAGMDDMELLIKEASSMIAGAYSKCGYSRKENHWFNRAERLGIES